MAEQDNMSRRVKDLNEDINRLQLQLMAKVTWHITLAESNDCCSDEQLRAAQSSTVQRGAADDMVRDNNPLGVTASPDAWTEPPITTSHCLHLSRTY